MGSAMRYDLLSKNPVLAVQLPRAKVINKTRKKPHLTPEEFEQLLQQVSEPYATMIYIAVFSGLRVSRLIGLKWNDVHYNSLTVDERYCRGGIGVKPRHRRVLRYANHRLPKKGGPSSQASQTRTRKRVRCCG